jgi:hypothetical protein
MITLDQLKTIFSKKEKKFVDKKVLHNASFYWIIFLYIIFAAFILSLLFGYYLFTQINKEMSISLDKDNNASSVVSKDRIGKVLDYFREREKKSDNIISSPSPVIDPSL